MQKEFLRHVQEVAISQVEEGDELIMTVHVLDPEPMQLRKTTLATQMAEQAYNPANVNTENTIPAAFRQHWRIFSEEEARQLPPHQPWDHKIELLPTAPDVINSKIYPLAPKEQEALDQYLEENLEKGYIIASSS